MNCSPIRITAYSKHAVYLRRNLANFGQGDLRISPGTSIVALRMFSPAVPAQMLIPDSKCHRWTLLLVDQGFFWFAESAWRGLCTIEEI